MAQARPTIKDIALAAGVSITTVSHALNHTRPVSPSTRATIQEIANRLGYRPDPVARMLQGGDSLLIGHIICELHDNLFFPQVARGADLQAQASGYATIISNTDGQAATEECAVELLLEKRVNGIIFTTPIAAANVAKAVEAGVAAVMIERPFPVPGAHAVLIDQVAGTRELTRMLIAQGHRCIAYLGGYLHQRGSRHVERQRYRGFQDALREAGITVPSTLVAHSSYDPGDARTACQHLLEHTPCPTALVIGSDLVAAAALQVLYQCGCQIPRDISVVSVDNTLGPYLAPVLTEASHPGEDMGRQAVDLIVEHCRIVAAGKTNRSRRVTLQPKLFLGSSTRIIGQPERDL